MSANLKLLPRKEFELILDDGTVVKGRFCTWALQRFGERKGLSLSGVITALWENPSLKDLNEMILCAVEYSERKAGLPNTFNDMKLCDWVDDYSEATGEEGVLMKLLKHMEREDKTEAADSEKKTTVTTTPGQPSSELLTLQD